MNSDVHSHNRGVVWSSSSLGVMAGEQGRGEAGRGEGGFCVRRRPRSPATIQEEPMGPAEMAMNKILCSVLVEEE